METKKYRSVDEYHALCADAVKPLLADLRETILKTSPDIIETISYNMPAFKLNGVLVYYAAYKNHIGFYPTAKPMLVFKDELVDYKTSKGAIQLPLDKKIPKALIRKIVKFRITETKEKSKK